MGYAQRRFIIVGMALLLALTAGVAQAQELTTHVTLEVQGMVCPLCQTAVERILQGAPGVIQVKASYITGKVEVDYDPSQVTPHQLVATINTKTFYRASVATEVSTSSSTVQPHVLPIPLHIGGLVVGGMAILVAGTFLRRVVRKPVKTPLALSEQREVDDSLP